MASTEVCTNRRIERSPESNAGKRTAEIHRNKAATRVLEAEPSGAPHGRNNTCTGETKTIEFLAFAT